MDTDSLTPAQRIEVQEFWLRRYLKRADFAATGQPERRRPRKVRIPWPHNVRAVVQDRIAARVLLGQVGT